jgi:hypothetical protein
VSFFDSLTVIGEVELVRYIFGIVPQAVVPIPNEENEENENEEK